MSLLYYMFQIILNTYVFAYFWWGKINYFHGWGLPPPPFAENFMKIINLIFERFPNLMAILFLLILNLSIE